MAIKRVFKNTIIGSQFLLKNGKSIKFPDGRAEIDSEAEAAELDAEIAAGVPHLYVDPSDYSVDTTLQDMLEEAKKKAVLEVMASYKPAVRPDQNGEVIVPPIKTTPGGNPVVPGASDEQQAEQPKLAPNQNLAHLLANKTASTGVTSSANIPNAASSAS